MLRFERLTTRRLLVSDLQNDFNSLDVDDDAYLAPVDALVIINDLQATGSRRLNATSAAPRYFIDVDGDNHLAPIDALLVINRLNLIASTHLEPMALTGGMAPESDLDGNGVVLRAAVTITGHAPLGVSDADDELRCLSLASVHRHQAYKPKSTTCFGPPRRSCRFSASGQCDRPVPEVIFMQQYAIQARFLD